MAADLVLIMNNDDDIESPNNNMQAITASRARSLCHDQPTSQGFAVWQGQLCHLTLKRRLLKTEMQHIFKRDSINENLLWFLMDTHKNL